MLKYPQKSHKHTEEWKKVMSLRVSGKGNPMYGVTSPAKGKPGYMLGKHQSIEARAKISKSNMGKKKGWSPSAETRKKMSESNAHNRYWLGKKRPSMTGENCPWWKGGITSSRDKIRKSFEYRNWRTAVFERDNFQCIIGGIEHGHRIEADHIKPFARILAENNIESYEEALGCNELWEINNGRTLCHTCHESTPTYRRGRSYGTLSN